MTASRGRAVLVVLAGGRARRYGGCKPLAPVGPNGEAVIDVIASDAVAAGFSTLVLVLGQSTGPAIRYHVRRTWPSALDVRLAEQSAPLGTVHAVLSAEDLLDPGAPFAVANADDVYGTEALGLAARHLISSDRASALVAFRLANATIGTEPVTRGICRVDPNGMLTAIHERRKVQPCPDGTFAVGDGRSPSSLSGRELVSVNLWVFRDEMRRVFHDAMDATTASEDAEVLLPEVVDALLHGSGQPSAGGPAQFRVLTTEGRCIGVTHPGDLHLVQAKLAGEVGRGERAATLWSTDP